MKIKKCVFWVRCTEIKWAISYSSRDSNLAVWMCKISNCRVMLHRLFHFQCECDCQFGPTWRNPQHNKHKRKKKAKRFLFFLPFRHWFPKTTISDHLKLSPTNEKRFIFLLYSYNSHAIFRISCSEPNTTEQGINKKLKTRKKLPGSVLPKHEK